MIEAWLLLLILQTGTSSAAAPVATSTAGLSAQDLALARHLDLLEDWALLQSLDAVEDLMVLELAAEDEP